MYSGYTTAALSLRAKWSLYHAFSFDRRTFCNCNSCCCCSNGAPVNPRSLYGCVLKTSTLIQWAPSRRFLVGGPRRFWSGFDGGFREIIELLAEFDDLCSDYSGGGVAGKRRDDGGGARKCQLGLSCYAEDRGRRWDDESVDGEEVCDVGGGENNWRVSSSNSWKFRSKEEKEEDLLIDSGGRRRGRSDDVKKVRSSRGRADDVKKVSDWRDEVGVEKDESFIISRLGDRRGYGRVEQRREGSQKFSRPRDVVEVKEKRGSSSTRVSQVEIRDTEEEASSSIDSGNDAMEKYVQEERLATRRSGLRQGELQRLIRTSVANEDDSRRSSSLKRVSEGRKAKFTADTSNEVQEEYVRAPRHEVRQERLKEGSGKVMRISEANENENMKASSSSNLVDSRKVDFSVSSTLAVKQQGKVEQRVAEHAESRMISGRLAEISEIHDIGIEASSSRNRIDQSTSVQKTGDKRIQTDQRQGRVDQQLDEHTKSRTHFGRFSEISEMHDETNIERSSISGRNLEESGVRNIDDQYSVRHSVQISGDERIQMEEQAVRNTDVSKQTNLYKGSTNTLRMSKSQQHFEEMQMTDREEQYTTVQESIHVKRDNRARLDQQVVNINRQYGNRTNVSGAAVSDAKRMADHERSSASFVNQVQGVRQQPYQTNEQVSQESARREEYDRHGYNPVISWSNVHRTYDDDADITNRRTEGQSQSASSVVIQNRRERQGTFTGRSFQSIGTQTALSGYADASSTSENKQLHERDDQTRAGRDEMYIIRSDVLESANLLDKSSSLYVGEFVDKLTQEMPTSDVSDDAPRQALASEVLEVHTGSSQETSKVHHGFLVDTLTYKDEKQIQESPRKSSSRSGPKGPTDEMWEVGGPSSQKSSRIEELEEYSSPLEVIEPTSGTVAEGAIAKRSHRSLWTYIADIIRKGWFSSAQSHTSTFKSGKGSSSNDSLGSEAWFSVHETDDNFVELSKTGGISSPKEMPPVERSVDDSHPMEHRIPSPGSSEVPRVEERLTLLEGSRTTSVKVSEGASYLSRSESLGLAANDKHTQGLSSGTALPGHLSAVSGDTASPTVEEEIAAKVNLQIPGTEISKSGDELKREKEPEVQEPVRKDMELKRRKLQRNKQVLKETFDEWEEAYKLEIEQRKIDEFFMKEALLEAKKAADSWEVPVGAVLVQKGRIIARGRNLVEELRDSTAHAEMICIREASNLLKTWRLAETTLYVTLEPCPMCAGAILQARIDTVVWGAPNKLLGADGSWVRLFPGDGGSTSLDAPNQIQGPVHPFHPKIIIRRGILATECADAMQQFFKLRRKKDKNPESPPNPSCLPISSNPAKLLTKMQDLFCMMFCL